MSSASSLRRFRSAGGKTRRVRRSARQPRQSAGGRSHAGADPARRLALGADRRHRRDDPAVHQPAILAAVLHRLHPAQHRIFLSADRADAAVHLPDLSGHRNARRSIASPGTTSCCSSLTFGSAIVLMRSVRKAAEAGWEFGGAPTPCDRRRPRDVGRADGSAAPHRRLEPAAQRAPLHRLSAVCRRQHGSGRSAAPNRRSSRRPPITCCRARACSAFRSRPSPTP